ARWAVSASVSIRWSSTISRRNTVIGQVCPPLPGLSSSSRMSSGSCRGFLVPFLLLLDDRADDVVEPVRRTKPDEVPGSRAVRNAPPQVLVAQAGPLLGRHV